MKRNDNENGVLMILMYKIMIMIILINNVQCSEKRQWK